ncbi:hypothetical protein CRI93_10300 [Longimonas halophila]|uniref:DUF1877 domain-containing protein n=1 Tax=Longimonas halophila TaxID=1469170 RepID=A0A2H3P3W7_9BACT|nr:hypothetical protein [Longimonas halophila]PEN06209.1 hypothetical protein CRI93_10300 [Longimonas halophila]
MGRVYDVYRYDAEVAVDLLSLRKRVQDIDRPAFYEPVQYYYDPPSEPPPRTISFVSARNNADLAMLVGPTCKAFVKDSLWEWHETHTSGNPCVWATRGARRVGWHTYVPVMAGAGEFPLRYNMPSDIAAIRTTLAKLTVADLQANVEQCINQQQVRTEEREGFDRKRLSETIAPRFLQTIRSFYQQAQDQNEIVVCVLR